MIQIHERDKRCLFQVRVLVIGCMHPSPFMPNLHIMESCQDMSSCIVFQSMRLNDTELDINKCPKFNVLPFGQKCTAEIILKRILFILTYPLIW